MNLGPCRRRSMVPEEAQKPDATEEALFRLYEFYGFLNGGLGGNRVVLHFLKDASKRWIPDRAVTLLDVRCGRGDLSAQIARWARRKKIEVRILAVDESQSVINLAREVNGGFPEINFEVSFLNDPRFLQAQQFDYVISNSALHSLSMEDAAHLLKTANLLAKRGVAFCDWLRDIRPWILMQILSRFWGDEIILHDAPLCVRKGFTLSEVRHLQHKAALDYLSIGRHLGYRFSIMGERALAFEPQMAPITGLVGA